MNERCTKCIGKGTMFKPNGFTRADLQTCPRCLGSGNVPTGSQKILRGSRNTDKHNKNADIESAKNVKAV